MSTHTCPHTHTSTHIHVASHMYIGGKKVMLEIMEEMVMMRYLGNLAWMSDTRLPKQTL